MVTATEHYYINDLCTNISLSLHVQNGGEDGGSSNAPLRGAKATVFDGGIRSPSFVYAPGHMKKKVTGTTSHE